MVKATTPRDEHFSHQDFLRSVQRLPPNVIFSMAEDGTICEMEIARIFQMMGMTHQQVQTLRPHYNSIAKLVLEYAHREMGITAPKRGLCQLTSAQSIVIMEGLLKRGLIQPYIEPVCKAMPAPAIGLERTQTRTHERA